VLNFDEVSDAGSVVESSGEREGDNMVVSSRGQTQRFHLPRLSALGPETVRRLSLAVPLKPGQLFPSTHLTPDYPRPSWWRKARSRIRKTRDVRGVPRKLWRLTSEVSFMPGLISTMWVDDQGNDVESLTVLPGLGNMHEICHRPAECMKQPEGAEIFASTLIHSQRALPSPHDLGQAGLPADSPRSRPEARFVERGRTARSLLRTRVVRSRGHRAALHRADATWQLPHADTPELHPYLQASAYLEVNAPEIQALARQAVGDERNPVAGGAQDRTLCPGLHHEEEDLNIGFGSAEETRQIARGRLHGTRGALRRAWPRGGSAHPVRGPVSGYIPPGDNEPTIANAVDRRHGAVRFSICGPKRGSVPINGCRMDAALGRLMSAIIAITKSTLDEINPMVDLNTPVFQLMESLKIEIVKKRWRKAICHRPLPWRRLPRSPRPSLRRGMLRQLRPRRSPPACRRWIKNRLQSVPRPWSGW